MLFLAHNPFCFGEYMCTFVMHRVYKILVADIVVFEAPLKFMTSRTCICNNMYEHGFCMYAIV